MIAKISRWLLPLLGLTFCFNLVVAPVHALNDDPYGLKHANNSGLGNKDPRDTVASLIRVVMGFLGTIAVLLILFGGFKWMMAQGNQDKVDEAKKLLIAGVVGLIIILSAYGIATYVIENLVEATNT